MFFDHDPKPGPEPTTLSRRPPLRRAPSTPPLERRRRINPLEDAQRRATDPRSPTLLTASILILLAGTLGAITARLFDKGSLPDELLSLAGLLAVGVALGLFGVFVGAAYVALTGGEHPDVSAARLWRRLLRRPSPTAPAARETFHIREDRRPVEQVVDFIRRNPESPGIASFKEIQGAFESATFDTVARWLREATEKGLVRQVGTTPYFAVDVLGR